MANMKAISINFVIVFVGIFAARSYAQVARKPHMKIAGGYQEQFGVPKATQATRVTTMMTSPQGTAAVGEIFSFDKNASPATVFGHVLIPCVLFAVLAVTLYGGFRGTQYLYGGLKARIQERRHRPSYKDMRTRRGNHAVVMVSEQEIV